MQNACSPKIDQLNSFSKLIQLKIYLWKICKSFPEGDFLCFMKMYICCGVTWWPSTCIVHRHTKITVSTICSTVWSSLNLSTATIWQETTPFLDKFLSKTSGLSLWASASCLLVSGWPWSLCQDDHDPCVRMTMIPVLNSVTNINILYFHLLSRTVKCSTMTLKPVT